MEDQRKTKAQLIEELRKLRKKYESLCRAGDPSVSEDPEFRIDSFYDSIQAGIILQSSDGEIIHTNTYASKIFNMPADKVTGRSSMDPVWNMVDEQEQPVPGKDHPSMITLRTGKPLRDVIRGIFSTDPSRMRWLLINTLPIFKKSAKKPSEVMTTFIDITEQKNLEKQAREDQRILSMMARNYPNSYVSIIEKDLSIGFTAGQEFSKQNLDPEDFIGLKIEDVFGEHTREVQNYYLKTFDGEEQEFQLFINGQHQLYRTVPLVNDDGDTGRIMVVVENITEKVEAEESARESFRRYQLLFETSSDAIFIADPETGMMIDCNPAAEQLTGRTSEELRSLHQFDLHPPEKSDFYKSEFAKAVKSKGLLFEGMEILHKDGRRIPVEISSGGIALNRDTSLHYGIFRDVSERLASEKKIAREQENLSALINNTDGMIWSVDRDFRLIVGNAAFNNSVSSLSERPLHPGDLVLTDDFPESARETWRNMYQRSLEGESFAVEMPPEFGNKDSVIEFRLSPIFSGEGKITGVTVFGRDVSEQKKSEDELAASREKYQLIVDNQNDLVVQITPDLRILYASPSYCRTFGQDEANLIGRTFTPKIHKDDREAVKKSLARLSQEPYKTQHDERALTVDGWRHFTWSARAILDDNGKISSIISVGRDITDRAETREQLSASEEKYRLYFEHSPVGYQSLDENGCILDVNHTWLNLLGYTKEEVLGKWFGDFLHPEEKELFRERFPINIQSNETIRDMVFRLKLKDGNYMIAEYTVRIGRNKDGSFQRTHCVFQDISERIKAEASLKDSELKFRSYIENSPYGIFLWDGEGKIQDVNAAACKISGFAYRDLLNLSITDLVPEENKTEVLDEFKNLIDRGCSSIEIPFLTKSGKTIFCSIDSVRTGPDKYLGFVQDVTARKVSRENAIRTANEWQTTFDASEDVIWILDREQKIIRSNRKAQDFFGIPPEQLIGKHCWEITHEEGRPIEGCPILMARESMGRESMDLSVGDKWFKVTVDPIMDEQMRFNGAVHVISDITERKAAEEALILVKNSLEEAQAVSHTGSWEYDFEKDQPAWSKEAYKIFGIDPDQPPPSWVEHKKLLYPDQWEKLDKVIEQCVKYGQPYSQEFKLFRPDGEICWAHTVGRAVRDENGSIIRLMGSVQDITSRKLAEIEKTKLQEQLTQAQKMESIGRLAGGVAHDFNNLLTAIQGFSELLQSSLSPGDPLKKDVEEIQKAADSASSLTSQLLTFSRKQVAAPKILDLNSKISSSEKMLRRIIGEDIKFIFHPGEDAGNVFIDPGQVDQILINLMVNSRDAMPEGGELSITTGKVHETTVDCHSCGTSIPGGFVMMSVTDTGTGMDEETLRNIFEPFYTTKETGKGTGLGMPTIHGIIHQNGGHIKIESQSGKGSTFRIYLPSRKEKAETPTAVEPDVQAVCSETVLLVEDKDIVRKLVLRILKKQGYKVIEAANGGEAFLKFEQENQDIDLLLTDVIMPEMSGKQLYERLLKIKPDLKALFMSGYTEDSISSQGILEEKINFIQKPFRPQALAAKLREVIGTEK